VHLFAPDVPPREHETRASALRHPPALLAAAAFGGACAVLLAAVALAPVVLAASTGRTVAEIASLTAIAALPSIAGRIAPGWLLERGAKPLTIFWVMALLAAFTIGSCLVAGVPLWVALVLFALFQISAGALPGLLSAMLPHVAPTPAQLGTVSGMCSQAVNVGNLVGPPAILAVYAAAGTGTAVAVMIVVLAASLAAIAGLPVFRRKLGQAA
jgi:predicted MFS family arabinose efflux permease